MNNKISIVLFTSFLAAIIVAQQSELEKKNDIAPATFGEEFQWNLYKAMHKKKYKSELREAKRKEAFLVNLRSVREHNVKGMTDEEITQKFRLNKFADWTKQELHSLTGEIDNDIEIPGPEMDSELLRQIVPDSIDLRNSPCMPAVKYQGPCGSCYAFAAVTTVEYGNCLKTGNLTILSEENLLDCSQRFGNAGCNGGLALRAFNYIRNFGVNVEEVYPYEGEETMCEYRADAVGANVTGWAYATRTKNEEAMKVALATYGPLAVSVNANDWQFYSGGVFTDPNCSEATNHAVVIVGYGTDPLSKKPYWIIRNSWGTDWGLEGYILMERGVNMCGVARRAVFPVVR